MELGLTPRHSAVQIPEEQAFEAMRTAIELGCTVWNGGMFYGTPENNSLTLLRKYFEKYPEDAAKIELNIKGCTVPGKMEPDGSKEGVFRDVQYAIQQLPPGIKKIDMFEPARVDKSVPLEETMMALKECQDKGWIGGVALSEASGETIRNASKFVKILAVEYELGLFTTNALTNGVAQACAELNIPIHA
jgi:pyridoxine 4-dehydrogenase